MRNSVLPFRTKLFRVQGPEERFAHHCCMDAALLPFPVHVRTGLSTTAGPFLSARASGCSPVPCRTLCTGRNSVSQHTSSSKPAVVTVCTQAFQGFWAHERLTRLFVWTARELLQYPAAEYPLIPFTESWKQMGPWGLGLYEIYRFYKIV